MRFDININIFVRPLLAAFGATRSNSYVETEGDELHVKFGFLFEERLPLSSLKKVRRVPWPLWAGLGWRTNFVGAVGLVGALDRVVRLDFDPPHKVRVLLNVPLESLYVSVEDADGLVKHLEAQSAG